jgi:hypothetical protein
MPQNKNYLDVFQAFFQDNSRNGKGRFCHSALSTPEIYKDYLGLKPFKPEHTQ